MLPRREVEARDPQPTLDLDVAHLHEPAGRRRRQVAAEPQRRRWLAHLLALGEVEAALRVLLAPRERLVDPPALEGVDVLVAVGRTTVVGDRAGADPGGVAQPGELLLLEGVGLLPATAGVRPRRLVGRPATAEPPPAAPVGAELAGVEVDQVGAHVVEQHPVVAGEQDDARQVAEEAR